MGALYELGCQVAIAFNLSFGKPPVRKYTIGGNRVRVDGLLSVLNDLEPGWGGPAHGTIIGSPRGGTQLDIDRIIAIVQEEL